MSINAEDLFAGAGGVPRAVLSPDAAQRAAMEYISRGWAVTAGPGLDALGQCMCSEKSRCRNPGKHAYKGWGNEDRRTLTMEQAERYWSPRNKLWCERPVDHVFIVPYLSGLVVADVDNEMAWAGLDEKYRPETLRQRSGSGRGGHWLYRYEWDTSDPVPPSLPGRLPGGAGEVKFRGIIAAAPSVHKNGGRYEWINWGAEIADAPKGLLEKPDFGMDGARDWDSIIEAGSFAAADRWMQLMFLADTEGLDSAGDAVSGRPVVIFAVAATMAKWVAAGWISEQEVVDRLLQAAEKNGALDDYGAKDMERQIRNGIRSN